jgi:hypothetical protein
MEVNGFKFPAFLVIPALVFTFCLGGLSIQVSAMADDQAEHEEKPAHTTTVEDVATIKANVAHNKAGIDEVKKELKEQRAKAESDKQEILQAIRER